MWCYCGAIVLDIRIWAWNHLPTWKLEVEEQSKTLSNRTGSREQELALFQQWLFPIFKLHSEPPKLLDYLRNILRSIYHLVQHHLHWYVAAFTPGFIPSCTFEAKNSFRSINRTRSFLLNITSFLSFLSLFASFIGTLFKYHELSHHNKYCDTSACTCCTRSTQH